MTPTNIRGCIIYRSFEAPNGLAEALIKVREKMFVRHFMRQQAYNPVALEDNVLEEYATQLAAPGGLRPGIAYFRAHKLDAEHNRENAKPSFRCRC